MANYLTGCSKRERSESDAKIGTLGQAAKFNHIDRQRYANETLQPEHYIGSVFTNCAFISTDMSGSVFQNCVFRCCHWNNCDMRMVQFIDCAFTGCSSAGSRTFQSDLFGLFAEAEQYDDGCFGVLEIDPEALVLSLAGHRHL